MPRKLTPQFIRSMEPPASGNRIEWDTDEKGLGIRITAAGHRAFVLRYVADGRERRLTLGEFPALGLTAAREMARERKGEVIKGADPLAEKAAARNVPTLGSTIAEYLAGREAGTIGKRLRPKSLVEMRRYLELHWQPLHAMRLAEVSRRDIKDRLDKLQAGSGTVAANRARAALLLMLNWAVSEERIAANPVALTKPYDERRRGPDGEAIDDARHLSNDEIELLWRATERPGDYGAIIRLLLLTGQRREEVAGMRWSELDLDRALWSLPKERTKNGLRHDVPLSDAALIILHGVQRRPSRDLLFGEGKGGFSGWSQAKDRLDARIAAARARAAGIEAPDAAALTAHALAPWRLHDLRRTVVTGMAEIGVQPHVIEAVVNHVSGHKAGVAGVYNRATYAAEKRVALQRWTEHVMSIVAGEPAKVVPLRQRSA